MSRHPLLVDDSVRTYEHLLYLYPPRFRSQFGAEMAALFRDLAEARLAERGLPGLLSAWGTVLRELPATLAREHWEVLAGRNPGIPWHRLAVAALLPALGAIAWRAARLEPPDAWLVVAWLACCVAPALSVWGRGWACVLRSMRGGGAAMAAAIAWSAWGTSPGVPLGPALLLVACAATAGLVVGVVVRAVVEGLVLRRPAPA